MRIWTALLAGSCAAFLATLVGAATLGLVSATPIGREPLYDLFLLACLAMTILCALPGRPLGQWLAALRISAALLASLCLLTMVTTRDPVTLAVTAIFAALLALLERSLSAKTTE